MQKTKLSDINIHDIGNVIRLTGIIYSDKDNHYLCFIPEEFDDINFKILDMDLQDWKKFIRQTDLLETEILAMARDHTLSKIILRKSARQIDQRVSWKVFERDGYKCRYCGISGVPMTVDHVVLWENGGPTIEENLVTACRKCNKIRGNTPYEEWIKGDEYGRRAQNLSYEVQFLNQYLVDNLDIIPRVYHKKSR